MSSSSVASLGMGKAAIAVLRGAELGRATSQKPADDVNKGAVVSSANGWLKCL